MCCLDGDCLAVGVELFNSRWSLNPGDFAKREPD